MPIDPNIALGFKPNVPLQSPQEGMMNALQFKNAMLQNQVGQQQLQSGQMDLQQKQQGLNDQKALTQAMLQSGPNPDPDQLPQLVLKNGGSPKAAFELSQTLMAQRKSRADLSKVDNENAATLHDQLRGKIDSIVQAPVPLAQKQAMWSQEYQSAAQGGMIKPTDNVPAQYPGDVQATVLSHSLALGSALSKEAAQGAEANKNNAQADDFRVSTQTKQTNLPKVQADADAAVRQNNAGKLANATNAAAYTRLYDALPADQKTIFPSPETFNPKTTPRQVANLGMTPDQQISTAQGDTRNKIAAGELGVAQGGLNLRQREFSIENGPGAVQGWAQQILQNPDSVKDLPPKLKTAVMKQFTDSTGLPLPVPLTGTQASTDTAARNALDNIQYVRNALRNPEIQKNLGPIFGRLGNAEQTVGTAVGLSPQAEAQAQEMRTRMRYLVLQEGKAVLGGRMPQQLMEQLEKSSPNVNMDPAMLNGALNGVEDNANGILTNNDRFRFGGKARTPQQRGMTGGGSTQGGPVERWEKGPDGNLRRAAQ